MKYEPANAFFLEVVPFFFMIYPSVLQQSNIATTIVLG